MNADNLRAAVRYFEEEPLRLHMGSWIHETGSTYKTPPCGTVACLAGSAKVLLALEKNIRWQDSKGYALDDAMEYFEITEQQADKLFYAASWPEPYSTLYSRLEREFQVCRHPHVWPVIKQHMVLILNLRVEDFIREHSPSQDY